MASKVRQSPESTEPREPTPREQAARSGDIDTLWNELTTRHYSMVDQEEIFGFLLRAIEVRCRQDPEAFAGDTFARMIGFVSYLTLRSSLNVNFRIARHGRATRDNGPADIPAEVADRLIPRHMDLQGHLSKLMQAQASIARQWELARAKRAENDRGEGGDDKVDGVRRSRKAPASPNGHPKPTKAPGAKPRKARRYESSNGASNGHTEPPLIDVRPINRIDRFLNADGSGSNGGHGDD